MHPPFGSFYAKAGMLYAEYGNNLATGHFLHYYCVSVRPGFCEFLGISSFPRNRIIGQFGVVLFRVTYEYSHQYDTYVLPDRIHEHR